MRGLDPGWAGAWTRLDAARVGSPRLVATDFLHRFVLLFLHLFLILGLGCSGPSGTARSPEPGPCFVLPGAMSGATRSYGPGPDGHLQLAGEAGGGAAHMRAAFHPDGRTLYISSVGPEWLDSVAGRAADPGIGVRAYGFDPSSCAIGPFLGETDVSTAAPSNERAYGLVVHPGGAYLYQTTASLGRIRIHDIGPDRVPVLRTEVDATGGGTRACAQVRRLATDAAGGTLYANCNNRDADAPMALQVWRVEEDGGLELLQHLTAPAMDQGVFDPVLHPSGAWLYHPLATTSPDAPVGPGAYVLVYRVAADGRLERHDRVPIRGVEPRDSAADAAVVQDYPITVTLHPDGETAYIARHVVLESEGSLAFRHGFAVYGLQDGGGTIVERRTVPATRATRGAGNPGNALLVPSRRRARGRGRPALLLQLPHRLRYHHGRGPPAARGRARSAPGPAGLAVDRHRALRWASADPGALNEETRVKPPVPVDPRACGGGVAGVSGERRRCLRHLTAAPA